LFFILLFFQSLFGITLDLYNTVVYSSCECSSAAGVDAAVICCFYFSLYITLTVGLLLTEISCRLCSRVYFLSIGLFRFTDMCTFSGCYRFLPTWLFYAYLGSLCTVWSKFQARDVRTTNVY